MSQKSNQCNQSAPDEKDDICSALKLVFDAKAVVVAWENAILSILNIILFTQFHEFNIFVLSIIRWGRVSTNFA